MLENLKTWGLRVCFVPGVWFVLLFFSFKGKIGDNHHFQIGKPDQWLTYNTDGTFLFDPFKWSIMLGILGLMLVILSVWHNLFSFLSDGKDQESDSPSAPQPPNRHEQYTKVRDKWVHEDDLINHRVTWLLLSQTILFAAYGVFMGALQICGPRATKLMQFAPWLGILLTITIFVAVIAAIVAQIKIIQRESRKRTREERFEPYVTLGLTIMGYLPPILLHLWFIIAWIVVIVT